MSLLATPLEHLGPFAELADVAARARPLFRSAPTIAMTRQRAREVLGFSFGDDQPIDAAQ